MATYFGLAVFVGYGSYTSTSSISNWSTIRPTYFSYNYNGTKTYYALNSSNWSTSIYTHYNGRQYAIYVMNYDDSNTQQMLTRVGTNSWLHNDSVTTPDSYSVNVNNKKHVYLYEADTPFQNLTVEYKGVTNTAVTNVFHFDAYWNFWKTPEYGSIYDGMIDTLTKPTMVELDSHRDNGCFNGPGTKGVSILRLEYSQASTPNHGFYIGPVPPSVTLVPEYAGLSGNNVYILSTKQKSTARTTPTSPSCIAAIHNGGKSNLSYKMGFWGQSNGGSAYTNAAHGLYSYITADFNTWASYGNYYSITVDGTKKFIKKEISVQLGKRYIFTIWGDAVANYDGVVLSKAELSTPSSTQYGQTLSSVYGSNTDVIGYGAFAKGGKTTTVIYTPSADGTVYMYLKKGSTACATSNSSYNGTLLGDVSLEIQEADYVTVTLNKNSGTGGTNSVNIRPGTAAANYPAITLPTRSGYIFQGYFDAQTGGTAYYNAAGQGTKVFDKVAATNLYAHWQQESLPTITVTLNDNGGSGGQGTAYIVSGQMVGTVTVPSRTGFTFLGYYSSVSSNASGNRYIDETGTGCKAISSAMTLYALWENSISYELLYSVQNPKVVTYSTSSQKITVSDGGWTCPGGTMSNIQYTFEGGGTVSSSDGGLSFTIPSKDVATYTLSVTLKSPTSAVANGYFGTTKTYSFGVRYIQKNIEFYLLGQEVYSPNTAQAKVRAEVAGTLYWGTSSSSMTSTQSITAGLENWTSITNATQTSVGTKTIYGYFVPSSNNYNWVGGIDNPGGSAVLKVLAAATTVTITLDDNGGSGGSGSIVVQKDSSCSSWPSVSVPTRAGFTFMGYFTVNTATGGSQVYYASGNSYYGYSTSSNVTIYARWKVIITYPHYNKTSETATEAFVSTQPGEATSTSSAVTMQINGQINCVISSRTVSVTTSGKTNWTINSTGTTLTIPSGTSYSSGSLNWQIVVADGTYNNYPYVGNTVTQQYSWYDDYDERPSLYYNLKKVEYVKQTSYPYNPIKYKAVNGVEGYNISSAGTPGNDYGPYGPYYYAYEEETYVTCRVLNSATWYQKYTNGTWDTTVKSGDVSVSAYWRIISETFTPADGSAVQNITRAYPLPGTNTKQLVIDGQNRTVYEAGNDHNFLHESMMKQLGKDTIVVRIYNPDDTTKYLEITKIATNSLSDTKYTTSECTTEGYVSLTKSNPTVTIGDGLTAAGGSGNVTCVCNDTGTWYQKYSSGEYEYYNNQSVTNPAHWRMTSQTCVGGTNRFSTPTAYSWNSTTLNIGGTDYTCFDTDIKVSHSSMGSNVGTDTVVITAYRDDDTTMVGTATKSISNILEPTHYTSSTCTTVGNRSSSYGTPSTVTIGDGLTAAGGSASVTGGTCTDTFTYYQKYTSGTKKSDITTDIVDSTITWSLSTSTFTQSGGSASNTNRFTLSGMTVNHTTMGTNAGTDKVVVRATNANATSKYKDSSAKSITNSLGTTHYKDSACTTSGNNISTYGTPTASIGDGLTAAGGSATVTCTVNDTGSWYQKYTSGSVATYTNQSISGTARWRITTNGNSRFAASGSSYSLSGVGTVYANGASVNHTTMGSYVGSDSVTVTAYNISSSTKTATSTKSVSNAVTSIAITLGSNTIDYNGTTSMTVKASYTSGLSTHDVTSAASISTNPSNIITITI